MALTLLKKVSQMDSHLKKENPDNLYFLRNRPQTIYSYTDQTNLTCVALEEMRLPSHYLATLSTYTSMQPPMSTRVTQYLHACRATRGCCVNIRG